MDCYQKNPLRLSETGIPVFSSDEDLYTQNYNQIAATHCASEKKTGQNPFMPDDLRIKLEESTRILIKQYLNRAGGGHACVLDVGVALGRLLDPVDGINKFGADISLEYLEVARQKGIEVCMARAEELPYKKEFFYMVVCTDVLEHVFDLNRVVENLFAALKVGGTLIVRVPQNEYLKQYFDDDFPYEYVHLRTFDLYSLKALFEKVFGQRILEWSIIPYQDSTNRQLYDVSIPPWQSKSFIQRVTHYLYRKTTVGKRFFETYKQLAEASSLLDDEPKYRLVKGEINVVVQKEK